MGFIKSYLQTPKKVLFAGVAVSFAILAVSVFNNVQANTAVVPPSTPQCGTGEVWTIVDLGRLSSLDQLTDPTNNDQARRQNSLNAVVSNVNLGTYLDITATIPTISGNGTLDLGQFVSWDGYASRLTSDPAGQANEQWRVEITDGAGTVTRTQYTPELADVVLTAERVGSFNQAIPIVGGVQKVAIQHYNDVNPGGANVFNSVVPAGFCYEFTPEVPVLTCEAIFVQSLGGRSYEISVNPTVSGGVTAADVAYAFDFGDGTSVFETPLQATRHTYENAGTYTITVTLSADAFNLVDTCSAIVEPPKDPALTCSSLDVLALSTRSYRFTANPVFEGGVVADDVTYTFDFGDGSTPVVTANNQVEYTYSTPGTYTITATLEAPDFTLTAACDTEVTATPDPELICDELVSLALNNRSYRFTANARYVGAINPADIEFVFDFGDGSTPVVTTNNMVEYTYATPGTYTAVATVRHASLQQVQDTCQTDVSPTPDPSLTCSSLDVLALSNRSYKFTANPVFAGGVTNADVEYTFDFGDGSTPVVTTNNMVEYTYATPGTYTVKATLTADNYSLSANCETQVTPTPDPSVICTGIDVLQLNNRSFTFTVNTQLEGGVTESDLTYTYNFGDGSDVIISSDNEISYTYPVAGDYTFSVMITAPSFSLMADCSVPVSPEADPALVCEDLTVVRLSARSYRVEVTPAIAGDVSLDDIEYRYDFGDGTVIDSDAQTATHTYAAAGSYTIVVTMTAEQYELEATCEAHVEPTDDPMLVCKDIDVLKLNDKTYKITANAMVDNGVELSDIEYTFDFGDGSTPVVTTNNMVEYTYAQSGSYIVTVTMTANGFDLKATCNHRIDVPTEPQVLGKRLADTGFGTTAFIVSGAMIVFATMLLSARTTGQTVSVQDYFNSISL